MASLDTNILMRFLLSDVPETAQKITDNLANASPNSYAVADAVFFELAWVLAGPVYQFSRSLIGDMLLQITAIEQINCNRTLIERAVPLFVAHPKLSFIDVSLCI